MIDRETLHLASWGLRTDGTDAVLLVEEGVVRGDVDAVAVLEMVSTIVGCRVCFDAFGAAGEFIVATLTETLCFVGSIRVTRRCYTIMPRVCRSMR